MRFVIFGDYRCGSSLLLSLLSSHPQICCDYEPLHDSHWSGWKDPLRRLWRHLPLPYLSYRSLARRLQTRRPVYGLKVMYAQVAVPTSALIQLYRGGWKVIHIRRRSLFAQTVSLAVALQTGLYRRRVGDARPLGSMAVDVPWFLRRLVRGQRMREEVLECLASCPHLALVYEEDLATRAVWNGTAVRIFDFLNLKPVSVGTDLAKSWDRPYGELITNYADLCDAVSRSNLSHLMDGAS